MGYSIPAAMGAKTAAMDKQVIAVCGDGSFQMSMMESSMIRQHNIPVKIIVLKNNYLGMVREYQRLYLQRSLFCRGSVRKPGSGEIICGL